MLSEKIRDLWYAIEGPVVVVAIVLVIAAAIYFQLLVPILIGGFMLAGFVFVGFLFIGNIIQFLRGK